MAKTLYFRGAFASTHRGDRTANLVGTAAAWIPKLLSEVRGVDTTGATNATANTVTGATAGVEVLTSGAHAEWLTEPLSADFTISGTITLNLWGIENNMSANVAINAVIDKVDGATGAVTQIAKSAFVTELGTTASANNFTVTPTSTAIKRGDRLRVRVFGDDAGVMAAAFTFTFYFDRSTAGVQGDSFITFTENLTFEPAGDPGGVLVGTGASEQWLGQSSALTAVGQSFSSKASTLHELRLTIYAVGAPTDNFIVELRTDSAGSPSTTVLATIATESGSSIPTSATIYTWTSLGITGLTAGTTYWIVLRRSGAIDASNYYRFRQGNTNADLPVGYKVFDGSAWSTTTVVFTTVILAFPVSTYYLTDTAESAITGAALEKKALTTRGSGSVNAVTNTVNGPTAPIQITNSAGGTALEWYTPQLNAFTLGGKAKFNIRALEDVSQPQASLRAEIAIVNGDGTSAIVWGAADIEAVVVNGHIGQIPTSDTTVFAWVAGDDTAVTTGQRLRFRILIDDCADIAMFASGLTATVSYNGTSAAAAGDTYVILPQAVTELILPASPSSAGTPLLITLTDYIGKFKRLRPQPVGIIVFEEVAVISSVTTIDSVETIDTVDSATFASVTATNVFTAGPIFQNPVIDNFNRNENPLLSPLWVRRASGTITSQWLAQASNGRALSGGGTVVAAYQGLGIFTDCDATLTINNVPGNPGALSEVLARVQGAIHSDDLQCYAVRYDSTNFEMRIMRYDAIGTAVSLFNAPSSFALGNPIGIRCYGSTIEAWYFGSGIWNFIGSVTDTTYINGYTGIKQSGLSGGQFDDFSTGILQFEEYTPASTPYKPRPLTVRPLLMRLEKTGGRARLLFQTPNEVPAVAPSLFLTGSGPLINDATRTINYDGDGIAVPDSSFGFWPVVGNRVPNSNANVDATTNIAAVGSTPATITRETTIAKFNGKSFKIVTNGAAANQGISFLDGSLAHGHIIAATGAWYSMSAWIYGTGVESLRLVTAYYNSSGVFISQTVASFVAASGWNRYALANDETPPAGTAEIVPRIETNSTQATTFYVGGVQYEIGENPTPYIGTDGTATANRTQVQVQAPVSLLNFTQGWMAVRFREELTQPAHQSHGLIYFGNAAGTDVFYLFKDSAIQQYWFAHILGGTETDLVASVSDVMGAEHTLIVTWDATHVWMSVDGSLFSANTMGRSGIQSAASVLDFGQTIGGFGAGNEALGEILWTAGGTAKLIDQDAITINAYGDADPYFVPLNSAPTFMWPADTLVYVVPSTSYLDGATVSSTTTLTSAEQFIPAPPTPGTSPHPLLVRLQRALDMRLLVPNPIESPSIVTAINYTDSATIESDTSLTSVETVDFVESATIAGATSVTVIETVADVEAAILAGLTSLTYTEVANYVESAVVASVTALTSVETTDFVDSSTITAVTAVTSIDTADFVDSQTIAGATSVQSVEIQVQATAVPHPLLIRFGQDFHLLHNNILIPDQQATVVGVNYVDSATISSVTSVQSSENTDFLDTSGTIQGTSSVTYAEIAQFVETAALATVTSLTYTETTDYVESATLTSITTLTVQVEAYPTPPPSLRPLLIHLGQDFHLLHNNILIPDQQSAAGYIDSATVAGVTSVQSSENTDFLDTSGTVQGNSSITTTEVAAFVDLNTVPGTTSVTSVEAAAYVESATIATVTAVTSVDVAAFVEVATVPSVTAITAIETTDYVETATVAGVTSIISVEGIGVVNTPPHPLLVRLELNRTHLLQNNILNPADSVRVNYVESATIATVTSVQSSESTDFLDTSGTIQGTSSITFTELAAFVDSQTVPGATAVTSTEIAAFVDSQTVAGVTSLTSVDVSAYIETSTITSVTAVTSIDTADFVDSQTVPGVTSLISVEGLGVTPGWIQPILIGLTKHHPKLDMLTNSQLAPSSAVAAIAYVDSATIASVTAVTSVELANYVDAATISSVTAILSVDVVSDIEAATVASVTSITSTDIAAYVDGVPVSSVTTPSSTDVSADVDAFTVSGTTNVSTTDVANFVESATSATVTSLTYTEAAGYVETATAASTTSLTSIDTADYVDSSTVASTTSIVSVEFLGALAPTQHPLLIQLGLGRGELKFLTYTIPPADRPAVAFTDSSTISSTSTASSTDLAAYVDGTSTSTVTSIIGTDAQGRIDTQTLATKTSLSYTEVAAYVETATPFCTTTVTSAEILQRLDAATITSITTLTSVEFSQIFPAIFEFVAYRQWSLAATRQFSASAYRNVLDLTTTRQFATSTRRRYTTKVGNAYE